MTRVPPGMNYRLDDDRPWSERRDEFRRDQGLPTKPWSEEKSRRKRERSEADVDLYADEPNEETEGDLTDESLD